MLELQAPHMVVYLSFPSPTPYVFPLLPGPRLGLGRVLLRPIGTFAGCLGPEALCPPNPSTRATIHPFITDSGSGVSCPES